MKNTCDSLDARTNVRGRWDWAGRNETTRNARMNAGKGSRDSNVGLKVQM